MTQAAAQSLDFDLASPEATVELARRLARIVAGGDTLLLSGDLGVGKTAFARALIQALLPVTEDVPSPTFTLVQVYDGPGYEIWHADLYRLSQPDQTLELGLDEALGTALCLIEWPEILGADAPADALRLTFRQGPTENARHLKLDWTGAVWARRLEGLA